MDIPRPEAEQQEKVNQALHHLFEDVLETTTQTQQLRHGAALLLADHLLDPFNGDETARHIVTLDKMLTSERDRNASDFYRYASIAVKIPPQRAEDVPETFVNFLVELSEDADDPLFTERLVALGYVEADFWELEELLRSQAMIDSVEPGQTEPEGIKDSFAERFLSTSQELDKVYTETEFRLGESIDYKRRSLIVSAEDADEEEIIERLAEIEDTGTLLSIFDYGENDKHKLYIRMLYERKLIELARHPDYPARGIRSSIENKYIRSEAPVNYLKQLHDMRLIDELKARWNGPKNMRKALKKERFYTEEGTQLAEAYLDEQAMN